MKAKTKLLRASFILTVLACALALPHVPLTSARQTQGRGLNINNINIRAEDGKEIKLYDRSYALVVGGSDYTAGWPKLPGVKKDIEEVARALERQGFQVTKVENPDSAQLDKSFKEFIDLYGINAENRLLFYFAGHGHTIKQSYGEEVGYIVPVDAPFPTRDQAGFMSKAMDMQQMELYARRIQSKHALFLFDSCFSGALFALSRAVPDSIGYKTARPVRQFITSGSADEQVPDKSIFRHQFVEAIEGEADGNHDGYVTGTELGEFLQDKVVNYSRNAQHPQYGKIRNPNLDKGDFVFALAKAAAIPPAVAASNPTTTAQPTAPPARVDPAQQELAFWNSVQNSSDPDDFKDYLEKYPSGLYAGIARRKLAALTSAAKSAPATPMGGGSAAPNTTTSAARPSSPKPGSATRTRNGIELVYVPPGEFMMGASNTVTPTLPVRRVLINEGFWMGKYEVTQTQWQTVMGNNPSTIKGDNLPVETISWNDAQLFIQKLNAVGDGFTYRLPSESEWEYAARAGTSTKFYWGDETTQACRFANLADQTAKSKNSAIDWAIECRDGYAETSPVGSFQPNAFGLYDMAGNVAEWCHNLYRDGLESRAIRGGSCYGHASNLVSANRDGIEPNKSNRGIGFRVVAIART